MGYADQLKEGNLISEYFLPNIFHLLNLYEGRARAFKLDMWAVDEYYLDSKFSPFPRVFCLTLSFSVFTRVVTQSPAPRLALILPCALDRTISNTKLDPRLQRQTALRNSQLLHFHTLLTSDHQSRAGPRQACDFPNGPY